MSSGPVCEYLAWDSEFFGRRIARAGVSCLTEKSMSDIDSWCSAHKIECLYFLADSRDRLTARIAFENGFRFVDVRVTLEIRNRNFAGFGDGESAARIRNACESDIQPLKDLASRSHRDTRFYHDGNFPVERCDEMYRLWIEKSCRGWAKNVLVSTNAGEIEGYISCHIQNAEAGQIGLVGVSEKAQGKGIGRELVANALHWFVEEGVQVVSVVTQGRNVRAQRLYQRCGFVTRSAEIWFHRWSSEARQGK
jgi:dTDP-4-amino-4,6-dideoxy-D-galactose acyltransferase